MRAIILAVALLLTAAPARAALFDDLGGEAGIGHIVSLATARFLGDPRIAATFGNTNMDRFQRMLTAQLCQVAAGPCVYKGHDMVAAHHGLDINQAQFNALVEDLQDAMTASGVAYHAQNRLLALLAPMQRDVVTR
jgi:hemoglobin